MNSSGSAMKENETYVNSLQGHLSKLNSAFQEFAKNTVNSDLIKWILDFGTQLIKLADTGVGRLTLAFISLKIATMAWNKVMDGKSLLQFVTSSKLVQKTILSMTTAFQDSTVSAGTFKSSMIAASAGVKTLTRALLASPLFWVGAATLGIYGIIKAVDALNPRMEDLKKNTEDSTKSYHESESKLEEYKNSLKEINEKISKLNKKGTLTLTDEKDLKNLKEEKETLEANLKIEEQLAQIRKQKAQADIVTQYETKSANVFDYWAQSDTEKAISKAKKLLKELGNTASQSLGETHENIRWETQDMLAAYEALGQEIEKQKNKMKTTEFSSEKEIDKEKKRLRDLEDSYTDLGVRITDNYKTVKEWSETLEGGDEQAQETQKSIKGLIGHIKQVLGIKDEVKETTEETDKYAESIKKLTEEATKYDNIVVNNIKQVKDYQTNVDLLKQAQQELSSSTGLTADTFLKLQESGLLKYLQNTENGVIANTNAFDEDSRALISNAEQALKAEWAQEQMQLILAASNGSLDEQATKLGLVNTAATNVDTENAVKMFDETGVSALTNAEAVRTYYKNLGGEDTDFNAENVKNNLDKLNNYLNQSTNNFKARVAAVNSIHLDMTKAERESSRAAKSSSENYKATIDTLYNYNNALDIAKNRVSALEKELKNTDNLEEQEKITRQLVNALNDQIKATNDLKNAQTSQINDYINQLRQQGFAIDYNNQTNELYINNMQHLADFSGDTAKNLEKLIKNIQSLNKDNVSLDGSVRDLSASTKDYYDQLEKFPEKKLKQYQDLMKDFQQSQLDQVQDQIDDLEHALEQDPQLKALKDQLEAMKSQTDEKDKQAELEEKMLAVEKAREALENARKNRTLQVYREGQGFVWETDPDAIADAQKDLLDAEKDLEDTRNDQNQEALEKQIEAIEKSYQDQIDKLQEFLDEQNYQIDKANRNAVQSFEELAAAMKKYGIDSAENLAKAKKWLDDYNQSLAKAKSNTSTLAMSGNGILYSSEIQGLSTGLTSMPSADYSGISLSGIKFTPTGDTNNSSIYIDRLELPNVSNANEFVEALKTLPTLASAQATSRT